MKDIQDELAIAECDFCSEPHFAVYLTIYEDLYWCKTCRECYADLLTNTELTEMQKHSPNATLKGGV